MCVRPFLVRSDLSRIVIVFRSIIAEPEAYEIVLFSKRKNNDLLMSLVQGKREFCLSRQKLEIVVYLSESLFSAVS